MSPLRRRLSLLLIALLLLVLLPFAAGNVWLRHGIAITGMDVSGVALSELHLRWHDGLIFSVDSIRIEQAPGITDDSDDPSFDPAVLSQLFAWIQRGLAWFSRIEVSHIEVGKLKGHFLYQAQSGGELSLQSDMVEVNLELGFDGNDVLIKIQQFKVADYGLDVNGTLRFDPATLKADASLEGMVADILPFELTARADVDGIRFQGKGTATLETIEPVVALAGLDKDISVWIVDNLQASQFELQEVHGYFEYDDPMAAIDALYARAEVRHVAYTFEPGVAPVLAEKVLVTFEKGILHIDPADATFADQAVGDSFVDIDFNDGYLLDIHLNTRAQLSGGVLQVLEAYGIPLPLEQTVGTIDTKLLISIDLDSLEVGAKGRFQGSDAVVSFGGQQFEVTELDLALQDADLTFHQLQLALRDIFVAHIQGEYDAGKQLGELTVAVKQFSYGAGEEKLASAGSGASAAVLDLSLAAGAASIDIPKTEWTYGKYEIDVAPLTTTFDLQNFSGEIPVTEVTVHGLLRTTVAGQYAVAAPYAQLQLGLLETDVGNLKVEPPAIFDVVVGRDIRIAYDKPIRFMLGESPLALWPGELYLQGSVVKLMQTGLYAPPGLNLDLHGELDFDKGVGKLVLPRIAVNTEDGVMLFASRQDIELDIERANDGFRLSSPTLAADFTWHRAGDWNVALEDISLWYPYSPILQRLGIDNGSLQVSTQTGRAPFDVSGGLRFRYPLLVEKGEPTHDYRFHGVVHKEHSELAVNDGLQVRLDKNVTLDAEHIGFNLPALMDFLKAMGAVKTHAPTTATGSNDRARQKNAAQSEEGMALRLDARDVFLRLDEQRSVPADTLSVDYAGGVTELEFRHQDGYGKLQFKDNQLHFGGKKFGESFLRSIITGSDFRGGSMEFALEGSPEDLEAVVRIEDVVLVNFKMFNNMLAFINTVPGLLTFNPPRYDTDGLPAKEVYAGARIRNGAVDIDSLNIRSDELDIRGSGMVDLNLETADLTFNLITGAKKSLQRIPLIGYIISGSEERPTLTLSVTGNLQSPEVKSTAFKEVATYPFQVIKRTVLLPEHVVNQVDQAVDSEKADDEATADKESQP